MNRIIDIRKIGYYVGIIKLVLSKYVVIIKLVSMKNNIK